MRPSATFRPFPRQDGARVRSRKPIVMMAPPSIITQHASVVPEDGPVFRILFPVAGSVENAVLHIENLVDKKATVRLKLSTETKSFEMSTDVKQGSNNLGRALLIQDPNTRMEVWVEGKADGLWLGATFRSETQAADRVVVSE